MTEEKISIECPSCGKRFQVRASTVGHAVKCTQCAHKWTVEEPEPELEPDPEMEAVASRAPAARSVPAAKPAPPRSPASVPRPTPTGRPSPVAGRPAAPATPPAPPKRPAAPPPTKGGGRGMNVALGEDEVTGEAGDPEDRGSAGGGADPVDLGGFPPPARRSPTPATPSGKSAIAAGQVAGRNASTPSGKSSVVTASGKSSVAVARAQPPAAKGSSKALLSVVGGFVVLLACGAAAFYMVRGSATDAPAVADSGPKTKANLEERESANAENPGGDPFTKPQEEPGPTPPDPTPAAPTPTPNPTTPTNPVPGLKPNFDEQLSRIGERCDQLSRAMAEPNLRNPLRILSEGREYMTEIQAVQHPKAAEYVKFLQIAMNRYKDDLIRSSPSAAELFEPGGIRKRLAALDSPDEAAVQAGREALLEITEPVLVAAIYGELTENAKAQVRACVAELIALRKEPVAAAALFVALQTDKEPEARQRIHAALVRLTGKKFGADETDKWKEYFRSLP